MKNTEAEENNPCLKEQELTYKCFHDNSFDKEVCQLEIENYKLCKSFWFQTTIRRMVHRRTSRGSKIALRIEFRGTIYRRLTIYEIRDSCIDNFWKYKSVITWNMVPLVSKLKQYHFSKKAPSAQI